MSPKNSPRFFLISNLGRNWGVREENKPGSGKNRPASPLYIKKGEFSGKERKSMDTKYFEDYLKQLSEWQKRYFDTWMQTLPNGKEGVNMSETVEKNLKLQEDMINSSLEAQQKMVEMMVDAQKEFWNKYFELMRKQPVVTAV